MAKSNKEIVLEVLKRAFIDRDPTVVEQYFGENYKQHNPVIPDANLVEMYIEMEGRPARPPAELTVRMSPSFCLRKTGVTARMTFMTPIVDIKIPLDALLRFLFSRCLRR